MAEEKAPTREWRDLAADLRKETDPERRSELILELDELLADEKRKGRKILYPGLIVRGRKPLKE